MYVGGQEEMIPVIDDVQVFFCAQTKISIIKNCKNTTTQMIFSFDIDITIDMSNMFSFFVSDFFFSRHCAIT